MDNLKLNSLNEVDQMNENVEDKSSLFVLDEYFDDIDQEKHVQYQLKSSLCLSEIYRKDFYNYVTILFENFSEKIFLYFSL